MPGVDLVGADHVDLTSSARHRTERALAGISRLVIARTRLVSAGSAFSVPCRAWPASRDTASSDLLAHVDLRTPDDIRCVRSMPPRPAGGLHRLAAASSAAEATSAAARIRLLAIVRLPDRAAVGVALPGRPSTPSSDGADSRKRPAGGPTRLPRPAGRDRETGEAPPAAHRPTSTASGCGSANTQAPSAPPRPTPGTPLTATVATPSSRRACPARAEA